MKYKYVGKDKHGKPAYGGNGQGELGEIVEEIMPEEGNKDIPSNKRSTIGVRWKEDKSGSIFLVHINDLEAVK